MGFIDVLLGREQVDPEVTASEFLEKLAETDEGGWFIEIMKWHLENQSADIKPPTRDEQIIWLWFRKCGAKQYEKNQALIGAR